MRDTWPLTHLTHLTPNHVDNHPQKGIYFKMLVSIQTLSDLRLSPNFFSRNMIFSIPKFTGKALEFASNSSMTFRSKGYFFSMVYGNVLSYDHVIHIFKMPAGFWSP